MIDRITKTADTAGIQLPVTLEMVKAHLRVTGDDEDALLRAKLDAAVQWAEETANRAIVLREYLVTRDAFPAGFWPLPLGRVATIVNVQYIDVDGVTQTWSGSPLPYETDLDTDYTPRLRPRSTSAWPTIGSNWGAARITLTAGWAVDDLPWTLKEAILRKVADLDEARAPGDEEPLDSALDLINPWILPSWA